jgi:hypothetical protein
MRAPAVPDLREFGPMPTPDDRRLMGAARAAHTVRRTQASSEFGEEVVRANLVANRWQSPLPHIVVLHNGPLTDLQRIWITLLAAPPGSVVGGLSAAGLEGLRGFADDSLTIVAPGSSRNHAARLIQGAAWPTRMRWSRQLGPDDVNRTSMPPRTRIARSIVDAASERVALRRTRVLVLAAVQQRLAPPSALWDALSRRGRCRNRATIAEAIVDAAGGIESLPEGEYNRILAERGLPAPVRQAPLRRSDGRFYLDNEWPTLGARAEIHGIPHLRVGQWDRDLFRQNEITIARGDLLIFSSFAIRHEARRVGEQTEALLRRNGWSGSA